MRVLIAEDEVKTREMVIEMLNSIGCMSELCFCLVI